MAYSLWHMANRNRTEILHTEPAECVQDDNRSVRNDNSGFKMKYRYSFGFTLIELMVVVAIIAFIISIAVVNYSSANQRARNGKRRGDLEQIRSALEMWRADSGSYPTDAQGISALVSGNYLNPNPVDPQGYSYYYDQLSANTYRLCAYLEGGGSADCGANCGSAPVNCNYQVVQP